MDAVDWHCPAIAGDVPVQLVQRADWTRREEKPDRVAHAVADDDCAICVGGGGDVDVVSARPATVHCLMLHDEWFTGLIGDGTVLDVELGRASLRGVVVQ